MTEHKLTSSIVALPYILVPVIKVCFDGIEFDILYAWIGFKVIKPDIDLHDENLLKLIEEKSIYSLNGVWVTEKIFKIIKEESKPKF